MECPGIPLRLPAALLGLWLCAGTACERAPRPGAGPPQPGEIYARAGQRLGSGWMLRPDDGQEASAAFALAPLLVHEAADADADSRPPLGALRGGPGGPRVDPQRPVVYHARGTANLAGRAHDQWTYLWWYAEPAGPPRAQGIRITLDLGGVPFLWEVLADTTGARLVFAADGIEQRALEAHGAPLPGRRFAVEGPLDDRPAVHVARVIEPGPAPLGPFVYLRGAGRDVMTVICRCMPSQVERVPASEAYRLEPLESLSGTGARLPEFTPWERLVRSLRLPAEPF